MKTKEIIKIARRLAEPFRINKGKDFRLKDVDPDDTLEPNDRFVREINKFPIVSSVPFHTIEGDRGRGNSPNSTDGVVPYWSSHLDGAQSELIVPSDHRAQRNPQAIREV